MDRRAGTERQLSKDKLLETAEKIGKRIGERFPGSGLSRAAAEIIEITKGAIVRAEAISRPNVWLRGGLVVVVLVAVAGAVSYFQTRADGKSAGQAAVEFLDATKGSTAVLGAVALFLFTLETRLKRRRALEAVHELRAMAHLIDMRQLAKDPDRVGDPTDPVNVEGRAGPLPALLHRVARGREQDRPVVRAGFPGQCRGDGGGSLRGVGNGPVEQDLAEAHDPRPHPLGRRGRL